MSALIRHGRLEADDYTLLADDAPLPASGAVIVTLERFRREREALIASNRNVGVKLPNTADIAACWPELAERPLLALDFPAFPDGRAYSQARLLAERYAYLGELRATGAAVVRDQLAFMARCGFNSFLLRADQDADACLRALRGFSLAYQRAADAPTTVQARRRS